MKSPNKIEPSSENKTPIYLNEEEIEFWKWCWKNYDILNNARKIRLGSTTLHANKQGEIKAEYNLLGSQNLKGIFGP